MNQKPRHQRSRLLAGSAVSLLIWLAMSAAAQFDQPAYREDRILVKPKPGIKLAALENFHQARKAGVLRTFEGLGRLQVVTVPKGTTVPALIAQYQQSGLVEFAEPDYLVHADATLPNDTYFQNGTLYGLWNYGQNGGTPGADIHATNGWDVLTSASNIVVAVLDSGIRYTHEDLASNMWVNPADGSHGWNAIATNNLPNDDNGHGTLMSGVLGAVGNNGKGVVGVAWQVQLMACKCLDSSGNGSASTIIACMEFARTNGARIINASLDGPGTSLAMSNAIAAARDSGIIIVASAGNTSANVDVNPTYPACYGIDNIVSVAYTTSTDALGPVSNYGATNVDLAAPGDKIESTFNSSDSSYDPLYFIRTGSSYAAAYVSGACALLLAQYPADNYQATISRLMRGTDPLPALAGKCRTGGRLNLRKALRTIDVAPIPTVGNPFQLRVSGGLNRVCVIEASTDLINWSPVFTNSTSANGTFDFSDTQSANQSNRFFRATAAP